MRFLVLIVFVFFLVLIIFVIFLVSIIFMLMFSLAPILFAFFLDVPLSLSNDIGGKKSC